MNLGEYSESLFATICIERGYIISKPFSHETRYDLIVDINNSLHRVQVKSTDHLRKNDNQSHEVIENISQFSVKKGKKSKYDIFKNNFGFLRHGL